MPVDITLVTETDDFNTGRIKWNTNDTNLAEAIDNVSVDTSFNILYFEKIDVSSAINDTYGSKFLVTTTTEGDVFRNGSVIVIVNGVYYISNTDQTSPDGTTDFHLEGRYVIIHDPDNGGSIVLQSSDSVGVYFQKV